MQTGNARKVVEINMKEYIIPVDESTLEQDELEWFKEQGAKELIRCKDCIHYRYYGLSEETVSECTINHCESPDKEWFCADGEQK